MRTCLVGLHDSGKSTALAALWFSVTDRSDLCEWYLANSDHPADASYWAALRNRWLSGERLDRTEHTPNPEAMKLKLSKQNSDETLIITVPDIAGEDFEKLYELGRFPKKHADLLEKSDHIVFFVHACDYDHPIPLDAPHDSPSNGAVKSKIIENPQEWHPNLMYPGSKIVAVLRGMQQLQSERKLPRITMVITAWDKVPENQTPIEILKQRFPLLAQYLYSNFDFKLLGLSAQGYDYKDQSSSKRVELDDITRITVVEEGKQHNDITRIFI